MDSHFERSGWHTADVRALTNLSVKAPHYLHFIMAFHEGWGALHPPTTHMQFRRVLLALVGDTVLHRALKSYILDVGWWSASASHC